MNPIHLTSGSPVTYSEVVEINKDDSQRFSLLKKYYIYLF